MDTDEFNKLKRWCEKFFIQNNLGFDSFDFNANVDNSISLEENKTILRDKLRVFFNSHSLEQIATMKKKEAEVVPADPQNLYNIETRRKEEAQAQIEFYNSLDKITESKTSLLLEQKFFILREYVKMVCAGNSMGLIVEGCAGLGKSFNVLKTLKESGKEFVYCAGFTTKLELYNYLFENRNKIIFFDDIKSIMNNEEALEILKSAMFSATGTRIVRYMSSTNRLRAPSSFIFEGGIIIALNNINNRNSEDLKAVVDRVLYYNVKFSYQEKMLIIADLIKQDYKDLEYESRKFIFDWLKDNTSEATSNLNFRLIYKLYEIYRHNKEIFEQLAKELVKIDKQQELILTLLKSSTSVKQAQESFCQATGLDRRTFYRHKAELVT